MAEQPARRGLTLGFVSSAAEGAAMNGAERWPWRRVATPWRPIKVRGDAWRRRLWSVQGVSLRPACIRALPSGLLPHIVRCAASCTEGVECDEVRHDRRMLKIKIAQLDASRAAWPSWARSPSTSQVKIFNTARQRCEWLPCDACLRRKPTVHQSVAVLCSV